MKKQRIHLVPGVKYRGHGFLNDFGEFEFTPEQTGSREGQRRLIKEGDGFTISETSTKKIIHLTVPRKLAGFELIKEILNVTNKVIQIIRDYEI